MKGTYDTYALFHNLLYPVWLFYIKVRILCALIDQSCVCITDDMGLNSVLDSRTKPLPLPPLKGQSSRAIGSVSMERYVPSHLVLVVCLVLIFHFQFDTFNMGPFVWTGISTQNFPTFHFKEKFFKIYLFMRPEQQRSG